MGKELPERGACHPFGGGGEEEGAALGIGTGTRRDTQPRDRQGHTGAPRGARWGHRAWRSLRKRLDAALGAMVWLTRLGSMISEVFSIINDSLIPYFRGLLGIQLCVAGGIGAPLGYTGCSSGVTRVPSRRRRITKRI